MMLIYLTMLACWEGPSLDLSAPELEAPPALPALEVIYRGDPLPEGSQQLQALRILIWLRGMELSQQQLQDLAEASQRARAAWLESERLIERSWKHHLSQSAELHERMWRAWLEGQPSEEDLQAWEGALAEQDPQKALQLYQREAAEQISAEAQRLAQGWSREQRQLASGALFFLRDQLGPQHEAWRELLGDPWPDGDFATLRRARSPELDRERRDLMALWTLEGGQRQLLDAIAHEDQLLILSAALLEPQLTSTCEAIMEHEAAP